MMWKRQSLLAYLCGLLVCLVQISANPIEEKGYNQQYDPIIAHTYTYLEGRLKFCGKYQCRLGSLIADAMIQARKSENKGGAYWTDAAIAFVEARTIQGSIRFYSDGSIRASDVKKVLRLENKLFVAKVTGNTILQALEHSVSINAMDIKERFLQTSGVQTVFNYKNKAGSRVVSTRVRCAECAECAVAKFEPLQLNKTYGVILQQSVLEGGDGYQWKETNGTEPEEMIENDYSAVVQFLKLHNQVYAEVKDRIVIIQ